MTNLKKLRTDNRLSQQTLADHFNLSQQSIYKYENGLAEPDISTLKEFAHFFGVSIDYLVGYQADHPQTQANDFIITEAEISLIKKLRKINPGVRQSLVELINQL